MRTKLIILTFSLLFALTSVAQDFNGKISVYPNPAVDYVQIELDAQLKDAVIELNSMIGNKLNLKVQEIGNGKYRIPVKSLASGYYFVIIKDEKKRFKKAYKILKR